MPLPNPGTPPTIDALPVAPIRNTDGPTFNSKAAPFVAALDPFGDDVDAVGTWMQSAANFVEEQAGFASAAAVSSAADVVSTHADVVAADAAAAAAQAAAGLTPDANFGMVLATTASTIIKTSAYTAAVGKMQDVDTSGGAFAITPPASPTVGQWFGVRDYNQSSFGGKFPWVVYGTDKIIGKAENCYIDVNTVIFTWRGATKGWCL